MSLYKLSNKIAQQSHRMRRAEQHRDNNLVYTIYLGTIGLLFIVPVIAGLYCGLWLDKQAESYSVFWSVFLLCAGIVIGVLNVYFFTRESQ